MSADPIALRRDSATEPPTPRKRPGAARARRVEELQRGNVRAWKHGIAAVVASQPDVAIEVALILASRPALDPLRDTRLVEHLAMLTVRTRRIHLAIEEEGLTPTLTSYSAKADPLLERLERAVDEREQTRIGERAAQDRRDGFESYRSGGGGR